MPRMRSALHGGTEAPGPRCEARFTVPGTESPDQAQGRWPRRPNWCLTPEIADIGLPATWCQTPLRPGEFVSRQGALVNARAADGAIGLASCSTRCRRRPAQEDPVDARARPVRARDASSRDAALVFVGTASSMSATPRVEMPFDALLNRCSQWRPVGSDDLPDQVVAGNGPPSA
jgi:hypothetical protein